MGERIVLTVHLPLAMEAVGRILLTASEAWPGSVVGNDTAGNLTVIADPDAVPIGTERDALLRLDLNDL